MYHILFIHSLVFRHLDHFYFGTIVNRAAMNMGVQVAHQHTDFISFGHISRSGIEESYRNPIFNYLYSLCNVFHSGILIYISNNSVREFPFLHSLVRTYYFLCF
jgi:hypothetical protein